MYCTSGRRKSAAISSASPAGGRAAAPAPRAARPARPRDASSRGHLLAEQLGRCIERRAAGAVRRRRIRAPARVARAAARSRRRQRRRRRPPPASTGGGARRARRTRRPRGIGVALANDLLGRASARPRRRRCSRADAARRCAAHARTSCHRPARVHAGPHPRPTVRSAVPTAPFAQPRRARPGRPPREAAPRAPARRARPGRGTGHPRRGRAR